MPRLRPMDVVRRSLVVGLLGVVPLVVATLGVTDGSAREEFVTVVGFLAGLLGAGSTVTGAGFWWASAGDIRRMRDWGTVTTQAASITLIGPVFLRCGLILLVLAVASLGLYPLVASL